MAIDTFRRTIPISNRQVWNVLGLPFDAVTLLDATQLIESAVADEKALFLSTPNLNFAISARSDATFFRSLIDSDLCVVDGMWLVWVAKLLGIPLNERVAGATLFEDMSEKPRASKIKVYFFGGQAGVAEQAHNKLNKTSSGMVSCGFYDPGFVSVEQMSTADIIEGVNAAGADFIVVALGAVKGQAWIQHNRAQLTAPVISHLGAVINFVTGSIKRAPVLWQRMGVEWLWRIKQEPTLWLRYMQDGIAFLGLLSSKVLPLAAYDKFLKSRDFVDEPCTIASLTSENNVVSLSGSLKYQQLAPVKDFFSSIIERASTEASTNDLILDFTKVSYIDGAFIATLMLFQGQLEKHGRKLVLRNVPRRVQRILTLNNVGQRFLIEK